MNTIISFSGGRTSGLMLWKMIDSYGGSLPENVKVCFANTGKEHGATLDFVRDCSVNFGVDIVWLEWAYAENAPDRWRIVDFDTASRNGEPFKGLVEMRKFLPNAVSRYCTQELKIRPMKYYAEQVLGWTEWQVAIGLRADEPRRVAKLKIGNDKFEKFAPLAEMGITKEDVAAFWMEQDFDLQLPNINGVTAHGNCDLCFLKGVNKRVSLIRENPDLADWWADLEDRMNDRFCRNAPDYKTLKIFALNQIDLFDSADFGDCFCTD